MPAVIDVHNHVVPESLPSVPEGAFAPGWPCYECGQGHKTMMISGAAYRKFDASSWSASTRRDFMDEKGIDIQVLSCLPELLGYWFKVEHTHLMCHHVNQAIAGMVDFDPSRFIGMGSLPMQDPSLAAKELENLKHQLGFKAVQIGSNIDGISPADSCFDEVYAAAVELDMAVFVHGIRPAGAERLVGLDVMAPLVGIPMDTAYCLSSFIAAGILHKFPDLRLGFSHSGGAFGSVVDRMNHVWNLMPAMQEQMLESPLLTAQRFYYDVLTFGGEYLEYVVSRFGDSQVFVGTDFPAMGMGLMDPVGFLEECNFTAEQLVNLKSNTAKRYLNI